MNSRHRTVLGVVLALVLLGVHAYLTVDREGLPPQAESSGRQGESPAGLAPEERQPAHSQARDLLRLNLRIRLLPETHYLEGTVRVTLPAADAEDGTAHFLLHAGLDPRSATSGVAIDTDTVGTLGAGPELRAYRIRFPPGQRHFELRYGGEIYHPVEEYGEDYARSFGWTRGVIGEEYVYLNRNSGWYPVFPEEKLGFRLEVRMPSGWTAVSQGAWVARDEVDGLARGVWEETHPQDGIYLLSAPFQIYERPGPVNAQVFLRSPAPDIAVRYLEATQQYLQMYKDLIGPYPYRKFALVENFWETGYGMPSFTLLGSTVLRLPFIITTSYPHEILHNWWGNGVYVDYASGNWSEGLTAYLSDHLIREQQGRAVEHRQSSLQKYVDYVSAERDFPLRAFRSRHGSATEAVGYTKMMMTAHMLRRNLGDPVFLAALRDFYRQNRFRTAGFADLEASFSKVSGEDLESFFEQWVERTGVPRLILKTSSVTETGEGYEMRLTLRQTQEGEPYVLEVPVGVTAEGWEHAEKVTFSMDRRQMEWVWTLPERPLRVDVDPEFDVMRRLHPEEIPPALSGVFGARDVAVVLPSEATQEARDAYRALARSWQASGNVDLAVYRDDRISELPGDRAVWLFGWENRLLGRLSPALEPYGAALRADGAELPERSVSRADRAVALGLRNPQAPEQAVGVFAADHSSSIAALGRRLPHFHKYSYLIFEGEQGENTLRGRWPVVDSPLTAWFGDGAEGRVPMAPLRRQPPLAPAPPIVQQAGGKF